MNTTKMLALATLTALGLLAASACDDAKKDVKADAKADAKAEAKADAKAADVKAADSKAGDVEGEAPKPVAEPAGEVTKIGVPECDDYIAAMSKCFASDGVPAKDRDQVKMGFDMSVSGWADAMKANPDTGTALAGPCKAALDMAKVSYPSCFGE